MQAAMSGRQPSQYTIQQITPAHAWDHWKPKSRIWFIVKQQTTDLERCMANAKMEQFLALSTSQPAWTFY